MNPTTIEDFVIEMRRDVVTSGKKKGKLLTSTENAVVYDALTKKITVKFEKSGGRAHTVSLLKSDCTSPVPQSDDLLKLTPKNGQPAGVNLRNTKHEFLDVGLGVDLTNVTGSVLLDKATSTINFCVEVNLDTVNFIKAKIRMTVEVVANMQQVSVKLQSTEASVVHPEQNIRHDVDLDLCRCAGTGVLPANARCTATDAKHTLVGLQSAPKLTQKDLLNLCISTQTDDVEIEEILTLKLEQTQSSGITTSFPVIAKDSGVDIKYASYGGEDKKKGHIHRVRTNVPSIFFPISGSGAMNQPDIRVSGTAKVVFKSDGRRRLATVYIRRARRAQDEVEKEGKGKFDMNVQAQRDDSDDVAVNASPALLVSMPPVIAAALYFI